MKSRLSHNHPTSLRVGKARRRLLYILVIALLATGVWWLLIHQSGNIDALPSPIEPWLMKVHGAAAMTFLFLSGTFLYTHMLNAWQQQRNRSAGALIAAVSLLIAISGYGLYYFNGDLLRELTEWLHWIAGFAMPVLLWWHIARGRRQRHERRKMLLFPPH